MPSIYTYLGIYIALLLIISWIISRKQEKEDLGGAIADYSKAIELGFPPAQYDRGVAKIKRGRLFGGVLDIIIYLVRICKKK